MPAPQFVVVHNNRDGNGQEQGEAENSGNAGGAQANGSNPSASNNSSNPLGDQQPEGSRVGSHIENLVNDLLRNFMDVFTGREFLRMQMQYSDFNPNNFMSNFN